MYSIFLFGNSNNTTLDKNSLGIGNLIRRYLHQLAFWSSLRREFDRRVSRGRNYLRHILDILEDTKFIIVLPFNGETVKRKTE